MLGKLYVKLWLLRHDRSGVTAVEYGVIAAAIVIGIVTIIYLIGDEIEADFVKLKTELQAN